jgi:protein required for attachment to host cells
MAKTWVLVAHQAGARILEHGAAGDTLTLLEDIPHPTARLKSGQIDSDRAGASFESARYAKRPMEREESAHARDAANFARELVGRLEHGRVEHRYEQLVLVAEPHFLGLLRGALDVPTASRVRGTLPKNLAHVPTHELHAHLRGLLRVMPQPRYH